MYARITSMQIHPAKLDELRAVLPGVGQKLKAIPGMLECKTCWDPSGKGLVFAVYHSQSHADAAADSVRGIWSGLAGLLTAPPVASVGTEVIDLLN